MELLELIVRQLPPPGPGVRHGIGDDCAVVRPSSKKGSVELLKTDALVEGIHFSSGTPWNRVGWKALCRPLSDLAAMGGTPLHALVSVAAPRAWSSPDWRALYRGIGKASREFGVSIVGGETVRSPGPLFLSLFVTGEVSEQNLKLRSGARPGDLICVTGRLGGSLESGRHLAFRPRLAEGRWLAKHAGVTAMMDLSDGLGSDLPTLARESHCSYLLAGESLPRNRGSSPAEALSGGEDYELLLTVTPMVWPSLRKGWNRRFPSLPLTCIGVMGIPQNPSTPLPAGHDHLTATPKSPRRKTGKPFLTP